MFQRRKAAHEGTPLQIKGPELNSRSVDRDSCPHDQRLHHCSADVIRNAIRATTSNHFHRISDLLGIRLGGQTHEAKDAGGVMRKTGPGPIKTAGIRLSATSYSFHKMQFPWPRYGQILNSYSRYMKVIRSESSA